MFDTCNSEIFLATVSDWNHRFIIATPRGMWLKWDAVPFSEHA